MKKILFSIIAISLMPVIAFAQIPNFSFENWTTIGSSSIPDNWGTMNNTTASFSVATATKGTPGNPGNFYLKLTSLTTGTTVTNGIAVSGVLDTVNIKAKSGFPCVLQPASLTGSWQHMIYGTGQGSVRAILTKWNTGLSKRDTVAMAFQLLSGMAMVWTNFTINFVYFNTSIPDSCIIDLRPSGHSPTNNDYLWVDNLALTGSVAGIQSQFSFLNCFVVFPNPSTDNVNMTLNLKSSQQVSLELLDLTGKIIRTKDLGTIQGETQQSMDVNGVAKGNYFLRIVSGKAAEVKKVVIQ